MTDEPDLERVPTLDGSNKCWAIPKASPPAVKCAMYSQCAPLGCTSGTGFIWIGPDQKLEYASLKLVS